MSEGCSVCVDLINAEVYTKTMTKYPQAEELARALHDARTRAAFARVDRSRFVPAQQQHEAWADHPLPLAAGSTLSQPSLVAQMTEWLEPQPGQHVLEIGTGSGYQTAILAELAGEVHTVEISRSLARSAAQRLASLGYTNIHVHCGDGSKGWLDAAPFERILATVAFHSRPRKLLAQLNPDGICIAPVGPAGQVQQLIHYQNKDGECREHTLATVRFISVR